MPINETTAKTSIDFMYEHTAKDGSTILNYSLQFSHTEAYGPTLTIYNEDGSVGAEVPVDMFVDTVRYLASRGVIPWPRPQNSSSIFSSSQSVTAPIPVSKIGDGKISMPVVTEGITEGQYVPADFNTFVQNAVNNVAQIDPVQSFSNLTIKKPLEMPVVIDENLTNEQILAERSAAAKKTKNESAKIKSYNKKK